MDVVIEVRSDTSGKTWTVDKSKDAEPGSPRAFRLERINLGLDGNGDMRSSCVAVPDPRVVLPGASPQRPTGKHQIAIYEAIRPILAASGCLTIPEAKKLAANLLDSAAVKRSTERANDAVDALLAHGFFLNDGGTMRLGSAGRGTDQPDQMTPINLPQTSR